MIGDSIPWKDDLSRTAARIAQRQFQRHWVPRSSYLLERDLMIGAFAARRLIESGKVSTALCDRR